MSKTRKDRAYDKGYEEGKEGGMLDDFIQKNKDLVPLPDHPDETSYDGGYEDGAEDRYDKENSHYQGGNYESKSQNTKNYSAPDKSYKVYESKYKPNDGNTQGWEIQLIKLGVIIALILGVIWLIVKAVWIAIAVILPLIIINASAIALIYAFIKKNRRKSMTVLSFLGGIYILLDYYLGGLTKILPENAAFFAAAIPFFFYLNFSAGLVAAYFIIRDLLDKKNPSNENETEFSKRNIIIMSCLVIVGGTTFVLQNYFYFKPIYIENTRQVVTATPSPQQVPQPQQNNYQQPAQQQAVEEYIPIPADSNSYPKEDTILNDVVNSNSSDFKNPDDYKYFKVMRSEIGVNSKDYLGITTDVLRHNHGNEYYQYEMLCSYRLKNTGKWEMYNCHETTPLVTYMLPNEDNLQVDLKEKLSSGWTYYSVDGIKTIKVTHLTYERKWEDNAPTLFAQIQLKNENTNENVASKIIVHYKQQANNNKWDITGIEPQTHSEVWN